MVTAGQVADDTSYVVAVSVMENEPPLGGVRGGHRCDRTRRCWPQALHAISVTVFPEMGVKRKGQGVETRAHAPREP